MCQLSLARLSMIERLPVCALQGQQLQKQPLLFSPVRCKYLNKTSFLEENVRVATSSVVGCMVGAFWGFQGEKFLCFRLFLLTWDNLGKTPGEWHRWRASAQEMSCLHCQDPRMPEIDWDRLRMIENDWEGFFLFSPDALSCWKGRGRRAKIEASLASRNSTFCLNSLL